jgi:hypothetical protein
MPDTATGAGITGALVLARTVYRLRTASHLTPRHQRQAKADVGTHG